MRRLRFTVVTDGSSDRALLPILKWLFIQCGFEDPIDSVWADLSRFDLPDGKVQSKIAAALSAYPCDVLFVHRDSEKDDPQTRITEVESAVDRLRTNGIDVPPFICVVPVRMHEAWLLFDLNAIRLAANNGNGKNPLSLPELRSIEDLPDPKNTLFDLIRRASELSGRRLHKLNERQLAGRVVDFIDDFSPLRVLPAFRRLEAAICAFVSSLA